jgi:hypothetical protein
VIVMGKMTVRASGEALYDVEGKGLTVAELKVWLDAAMHDHNVRRVHRAAQRRLGVKAQAVRWITADQAREMADELDAAKGDPVFERRVAQRMIDERIGLIYERMQG